jgi:hypothetical protein
LIVLDTNIPAYAGGRDHVLKEPCRRLLNEVVEGAITATTTTEVIQEFVHVRARSRGRTDAVQVAAHSVDVLSPLIVIEEEVVSAGLLIYEKASEPWHVRLGPGRRDHRAQGTLVSADSAFGSVGRLRHIEPGMARFEALVGR